MNLSMNAETARLEHGVPLWVGCEELSQVPDGKYASYSMLNVYT